MIYRHGGTADMGDLDDIDVLDGRFRFASAQAVETLTVNFSGGTGTADLQIWRDRYRDGVWGRELLWTEAARGTGADVLIAITPDDPRLDLWSGDPDTDIVLVWTNPDMGNMSWRASLTTRGA